MSTTATKKDLRDLERRLDKKFDDKLETMFAKAMNHFNDRFDTVMHYFDKKLDTTMQYFDKKFAETTKHFDVVAENIHADVAGANADEISLIKQKHDSLEQRVSVVEEKVGI